MAVSRVYFGVANLGLLRRRINQVTGLTQNPSLEQEKFITQGYNASISKFMSFVCTELTTRENT
ncbi:hypothetical protein [Methyloglobulus sp.]|uniref:hypothetical protein n=1 Tax=Methyloglobulus sp. TaxID=2518622 RepID=UPI0032B819EE